MEQDRTTEATGWCVCGLLFLILVSLFNYEGGEKFVSKKNLTCMAMALLTKTNERRWKVKSKLFKNK